MTEERSSQRRNEDNEDQTKKQKKPVGIISLMRISRGHRVTIVCHPSVNPRVARVSAGRPVFILAKLMTAY